jgi:hypothetical protein
MNALLAWGLAWQLVGAAGPAEPAPPPPPKRAPLLAVGAPGDHRLELTAPLYGASLTRPRFQDLRVLGPDGQEVPYVIRLVPPTASARPAPAEARILDPVLLPDGTSRAVLDLEGQGPRTAVELEIDGQDYLRQVRVESSLDGREFGLLAQGAFVFDVATGGPRARRTRVSFPATHARYLRVSLLPGRDGAALPIRAARVEGPGGQVALPRRELGLPITPAPLADPPDSPRRSAWALGERPLGLPLEALALEVRDAEFVRRVRVEATTRGEAWFEVGGGVVFRVRRTHQGETWTDESLEVWMEPGERPRLRVIFADGDDPPLQLVSARAVWRPAELVFRARQAGPHELRMGQKDARAPRYDLAELLARGSGAEPVTVSLGPLEPVPESPAEAGPDTRPWSERHALWLQLGVGLLAGLLLLWTLRLMFRPARRKEP